ncbi:cobaltochelatase subunit CobN [Roseiflexus castenholzii]|uniref:Cobaltochelatase, CobN subunit n=1 Tax=Roseiflexus castenholzii (strain DSM 13941 / HLO8) TaxID=383372 RepID=A7NH26_ROSCS|nr:cobaltochelatase subunit CobN [Roseiflexus castenholzii]ABU56773.1 cobaltochelatase, CobN subunit [Roseiflexus castenholzii DSM 13941]
MAERLKRNMVQRTDGRLVNAGARRGMLIVCATGCCCGHTERGFAPVPVDRYHQEWERRKLRNRVHLSQGGCLGPCPLANVALLLIDGRPYWFHSLNDAALVPILYDYIEALLATDRDLPPPPALASLLFNGFAWDGSTPGDDHREPLPAMIGDGILVLSQADTDLLTLEQARAFLPEGFAPLRVAHIGRLTDDAAVNHLLRDMLPGMAVVVVRLHSAGAFAYGLERLQEWARATGGFLLCLPAVETLDPDLMARSTVGVPLALLVGAYFQCGGTANVVNGLQCLSDHLLLSGWGYEPPVELPMHGIYTPVAAPCCAGAADDARPVAGVLFYRAHLLSGNTAFVDAIIAALQAHGLRVRAVYTQSLKDSANGGYPDALRALSAAGPVDVVISTLSFALGESDPHPFALLDAPVVQALVSSASRDEWLRNGRGLGPLDTAMNVAIPEFDGRIIGVPTAFKEQQGESPARSVPDEERIARLAGLARRLAALRRKPNAAKRIAFVFTNSSAKAQRIGNAVGLDAPASLMRLLDALQNAGYRVEDLPASGDRLIADLIARCSYDETWLTTEQLQQAYHVSGALYTRWFADLPPALQEAMIRQWGPPPGGAYVHHGDLALAGMEFGNIFVALQPPRGYDMDPNAIYHRPDLPPPHNYYALYRWLRDEWKADAIVHLGKHGTLEWLPGKGVGLGATCFPDQFLGDLPLIYPFIINDPGEGTQAKRRAHAVIVDHLTPLMTSAGAYGDLAELAQLVDEYYRTEQLDPGKLPLLQRQIWEVLQRSNLDDDLRYILQANHGDHRHEWDGSFLEDGTPTALAELEGREVAHLLEDIEGYLCELTGAQIRDGLHILGVMPSGEQLVELVYHLLRLPNLDTPSLPEAVAAALGEDWQALRDRPGLRRVGSGTAQDAHSFQTNADVIEHVETLSKALLRYLEACDWCAQHVEQAITATLPVGSDVRIAAALRYACETLMPNLRRSARDEIAHLLAALEGRFVPPGPSGAPTRGMAHVLPTGRNFYGVDPRALPSPAAWQTGEGLARDLIARYRREYGRIPESVGISIWGTSALRTAGDDIAQTLALLGVRPRWQRENRRVIGIDVVPLEELGRPRIDVVCRISGFFRDAFPHLIALIDHAVQAVIALDEPPEMNFPRKHALDAVRALRSAGRSEEEARREATYRIFGSKPGSYGAGILPLIDAQNWERDADFARVYLTWGGYAYTATAQGIPAEKAFAAALSRVQVATKNQDTREHDIFDSDDYLQFHGGMIAAIRALTGKNPARYFGDSSDPARPRTRDLREEARRVFRARVINPKWIASMQRHGYKGGLELAATVDYLFGYDATAGVLDDWMYERVTERYLRDPEVRQWLEQVNPWALHAMAERLYEAIGRGMWASPSSESRETLEALLEQGDLWREGVEG